MKMIATERSKIQFIIKRKFYLKNRSILKKSIVQIFSDYGKPVANISYLFCSDEEILRVNRQFLNHDYVTDIITFDHTKGNSAIVADIIISIDTIFFNAKEYKVSFIQELSRIIFHGALHLCGFNDKTVAEGKKMKELENFYLNKFLKFRIE